MASSTEFLQGVRNGIVPFSNGGAPTYNIIQGNPLSCSSDPSVMATPPSVSIQPSLATKCGVMKVCVTNTGTGASFFNLDFGLMLNSDTGSDKWGTLLDEFAPFATEVATAVDCSTGSTGGEMPRLQLINSKTQGTPIVVGGFVVKILSAGDPDNSGAQRNNSIILAESNVGNEFRICTRELEVNPCDVCVNSNGSENIITFNGGDGPFFIDSDHGFFYRVEGGMKISIQYCILGVADVYNYAPCSTVGFRS